MQLSVFVLLFDATSVSFAQPSGQNTRFRRVTTQEILADSLMTPTDAGTEAVTHEKFLTIIAGWFEGLDGD